MQQDLSTLQTNSIQDLGINSAIFSTERIKTLKENSLAKVNETITILGQLRICRQGKGQSITDVDNLISTASSKATVLNVEILGESTLIQNLQNDRQAILSARTVRGFQTALNTAQSDLNKVESEDAAIEENDQLFQNKIDAEDDLRACSI